MYHSASVGHVVTILNKKRNQETRKYCMNSLISLFWFYNIQRYKKSYILLLINQILCIAEHNA